MTVARRRRLLTIAHSYCIDLNRRLANELALTGEWDVTAVGPSRFHGDFGWHTLQPRAAEACVVAPVQAYFSRRVHFMLYGSGLAKLLREPWDLVHCWEEPYVASAAQVAHSVGRDTPVVFATFQNIAKRYPPPFNAIEHYTRARAAGIIAFGRTAFEIAAARGPSRTPMRVIAPGVDVGLFRPDPEARARVWNRYGWADGPPVVGFLGRFVEEKGCRLLMHALDRLEEPWRALFVGSGPLESDIRAWSSGYGDRVRVETSVSHDDVPSFLNAMDVLCAPSQTTKRWREQFGRMLIEAFACGVPVIASDSGEIPYVIDDAGLLVSENDVGAWTLGISRLIANRTLRADLARRGRLRAESSFAWPVVARQHLDFFEEVLDRFPGRAVGRLGSLRETTAASSGGSAGPR
jgi:glycosyltransferase involved in cell wall biosynthesis